MKAFLAGAVMAAVLAVAAGSLLEGRFSRQADQTYATQSVRVGEGPSIEVRDFSGPSSRGE